MAQKGKKQFGVWMDGHNATIIGREQVDSGDFVVLGHVKNEGVGSNSNENAANNLERKLQNQFYKAITAHMQNVDEIYVTGTGKAQEQFIKYLAETPQYKNAQATEATANKMSDEQLVKHIAEHFGVTQS